MTTDKKLPLYIYLILIVVTALQITLFSYRYFNQKKMYYADEYFTYGLANSATQPFLYGSKLYTFDNYDVTLTGDEFRNYISTNEDTAFNYKTCWNNQVSDTLPPLYQLIVHTISSFNADSFSWGWAFYINLTAFVIAQFFLFRIKRIMNPPKKSFSFSDGSIRRLSQGGMHFLFAASGDLRSAARMLL